jgi:hypothetical protein
VWKYIAMFASSLLVNILPWCLVIETSYGDKRCLEIRQWSPVRGKGDSSFDLTSSSFV